MKKIILALTITLLTNGVALSQEKYGRTLNLGVGLGYYGAYSAPALHANYEFDIFKNATLAPFVTFQSYRRYATGYDKVRGYGNYYYRETYIPLGLKFSYYFDELFNAGEKWDFYAAGSLGFALRTQKWEDEYSERSSITSPSPLYGTLHIGSELHLNDKVGLFLDLSTGLSTFGLAIHM
jgi:hypothetical protein